MTSVADQECKDNCANGSLDGNGERLIAYRGWGTRQVGWTSFDGRSWQPLAFTGRPEKGTGWLGCNHCTNSLSLTVIGVTCTDSSGATWSGVRARSATPTAAAARTERA